MKHMKKPFAMLLCVAMVLSLCMTFAGAAFKECDDAPVPLILIPTVQDWEEVSVGEVPSPGAKVGVVTREQQLEIQLKNAKTAKLASAKREQLLQSKLKNAITAKRGDAMQEALW